MMKTQTRHLNSVDMFIPCYSVSFTESYAFNEYIVDFRYCRILAFSKHSSTIGQSNLNLSFEKMSIDTYGYTDCFDKRNFGVCLVDLKY